MIEVAGEALHQFFSIDSRTLYRPDTHRTPVGILVDRLIQRILYQQRIIKREGFPGAPEQFFVILLSIRVVRLVLAHNLLDSFVMLLQAFTQFFQWQPLDRRAFVLDARDAPLAIFLFQAENRPEPVAASRSEEHTSELQSRENLVCRL